MFRMFIILFITLTELSWGIHGENHQNEQKGQALLSEHPEDHLNHHINKFKSYVVNKVTIEAHHAALFFYDFVKYIKIVIADVYLIVKDISKDVLEQINNLIEQANGLNINTTQCVSFNVRNITYILAQLKRDSNGCLNDELSFMEDQINTAYTNINSVNISALEEMYTSPDICSVIPKAVCRIPVPSVILSMKSPNVGSLYPSLSFYTTTYCIEHLAYNVVDNIYTEANVTVTCLQDLIDQAA